MNKLQNMWAGINNFFGNTKLGQFIKSALITFTGIFFGMIVLTPAWNSLTGTALPTIQQLKDLIPVLADSFYRALWAFIMVEAGVYKYNSSAKEKTNPVIIPTKTE